MLQQNEKAARDSSDHARVLPPQQDVPRPGPVACVVSPCVHRAAEVKADRDESSPYAAMLAAQQVGATDVDPG